MAGRHVVEADHGDVFGNVQPKLEAQHVHHREGHVIVADEDRVGPAWPRANMRRAASCACS